MSFYPDFYRDFILFFIQLYPDEIRIKSGCFFQVYPNFIQALSRFFQKFEYQDKI